MNPEVLRKKVEEFSRASNLYSYEEMEQIIEIIYEEERLSRRDSVYYNFYDSFKAHGTIWDNTAELVNWRKELKEDSILTNRDVMKLLSNSQRLFQLTTGRWMAWEYVEGVLMDELL